jgi:hypothetical protein
MPEMPPAFAGGDDDDDDFDGAFPSAAGDKAAEELPEDFDAYQKLQ